MARPRKEGLEYFPHDTDASGDEKVEALRAVHGNDGYAFYFILLERIYRTSSFELDISDAETRQILARKVGITEQKFEEILKTALKHDAFDKEAYDERHVLTSDGIKKRAAPVLKKRSEMREKYEAEMQDQLPVVSDAETLPETPQSIVKQSIVKQLEDHSSDEAEPVDFVDNPDGRSESDTDPCRLFMDHYNATFKALWKRPLLLTDGRKTKIRARLKKFSITELLQAATNIRASPYQCGQNPNRQVYATPEFICRSDEMVDKWLNKEVPLIGDPAAQVNTPKRGRYDRFVVR